MLPPVLLSVVAGAGPPTTPADVVAGTASAAGVGVDPAGAAVAADPEVAAAATPTTDDGVAGATTAARRVGSVPPGAGVLAASASAGPGAGAVAGAPVPGPPVARGRGV
ncbi:hypothetical protein M3677_17730, partial [Curtobacterium sp. P97]|nr:hypothetical protein [Curtobacterium sp. P97]